MNVNYGTPVERVSAVDALDTNLIDLAIWTMMSDRQARSAKDIVDNLVRIGYHRTVADKRLDTLLKAKNNWFDRPTGQRGGMVRYSLKKNVKKPADKKAPVIKENDVQIGLRVGQEVTLGQLAESLGVHSTVVIKYLMNKGIMVNVNQTLSFEQASVVTEKYGHNIVPRPNMIAASVTPMDSKPVFVARGAEPVGIAADIMAASEVKPTVTPEVSAAQVAAASFPTPKELAEQAVEMRETKRKQATHVIEPGDSVDLAIWKVMSDYKPYSSTDVATMLSIHGFKPTTVRPRISTLHGNGHDGWFTRITDHANHRQFIYTLRREIEAPVNKPGTAVTAKAPRSGQASLALTETAAPTPTNPAPQEITMPANQDLPLLQFNVSIKGKQYSIDEARAMGQELLEGGFGEENDDKGAGTSRFLKVKIELDGMAFTMEEANTLTLGLLKEGVIKK